MKEQLHCDPLFAVFIGRQNQRALRSAILMALGFAATVAAQGSLEDYRRAEQLREKTRDKVVRDHIDPNWFDNGTKFWYRNDLFDQQREFIVVDSTTGQRRPAFDHAALAEALAAATEDVEEYEACKLPFRWIKFRDDETVQFNASGNGWLWNPTSGKLTQVDEIEPPSKRSPRRPRRPPRRTSDRSPNGMWTASISDHDVILRKKDSNDSTTLTTDGTSDNAYLDRFYWSPDSKRLVVLKKRFAEKHTVYLIESAPKNQLQPKLHSFDYLKPGDRIAVSKPHLFDVEAGEEIEIDGALFENPWAIQDIRWRDDSSGFQFFYNQRGHQVLRIIFVDAASGAAKPIIEEISETFIDYAGKKFAHYVEDHNEIIWMSERNGWNHLYLFDSMTGEIKNQITQGDWVVRGVDRIDEESRQIWFRAGGIHAGQDPYYEHFCRVDFDGSNLTVLTQGDGTHTIQYSPDRRHFIDSYSRVDMAPVSELRKSKDGTLVCELERGDWSALLATSWKPPERFVAKGRDGKTDIHGVIFRPTNFDPSNSYPVIEKIYAGPHSAFVPKKFSSHFGAQTLAELGFIVVRIDGMGTSHRSKAFHDVCWKNLADSGFPDRILWIKAAAKKYPSMDIRRVGIFGGSAGGQSSTRAVLAHGDFYQVAVSDCGCHDNRMDKIWWNELWMGWPVGPHYAEQSNVTNAHRLRGKLLLIVGELDRNVDPASTMQVVDALVKADKDFDMLVIPGAGHGSAESRYGRRRRRDFFVRHLLGVEPRWTEKSGNGPVDRQAATRMDPDM